VKGFDLKADGTQLGLEQFINARRIPPDTLLGYQAR
jgi:hypothetical protein